MQGLFCPGCKSLLAPGSNRCMRCGMTADGLVTSNQSSLSSIQERRAPEPRLVQSENRDAPYMPYEPRGCQLDIICDIRSFLDEGRHVVIESGTGTGKTIVSLAASLQHAKATGKKIVYVVRTITQTDAVMKELRAISRIKSVSGIALTGRNKSCPLFRGTSGFEQIPSNVLSMMCEDRRNKSIKGQAGGCRFYDRLKTEIDNIERYCRENIPSSDDLDRFCEKLGVCPYEAKKLLLKKVDVIAAPYIQILNPDIRESLMANMDLSGDPRGMMVIVDEAHNFLDAARGSETFVIDKQMVDNAIDECPTYRDPTVWEEVRLDTFLNFFKVCIRAAATEKLGFNEHDYVFTDDFIEDKMMAKFGMSRSDLESAVERALDLGEARTERLIDSGENRTSYVEDLAVKMKAWFSSGSDRFVRSIKTDKDGEYLVATCIDPSEISRFLNTVPGTLHMSGTLKPLDQYARVLGLGNNPKFRTYPAHRPPQVLGRVREPTQDGREPREVQVWPQRGFLLGPRGIRRGGHRLPRRRAVSHHHRRHPVPPSVQGAQGHERPLRPEVRTREGMAVHQPGPRCQEDQPGHGKADQDGGRQRRRRHTGPQGLQVRQGHRRGPDRRPRRGCHQVLQPGLVPQVDIT